MTRIHTGRVNSSVRNFVEESHDIVAIESTDRGRDGASNGVHSEFRETHAAQQRALVHADALHTRFGHKHEGTPDRSLAQRYGIRNENKTVAAPREPTQSRSSLRRRDVGIVVGSGGESRVEQLARFVIGEARQN